MAGAHGSGLEVRSPKKEQRELSPLPLRTYDMTRLFTLAFLLALWLAPLSGLASGISLSEAQRVELRKLVASDPSAKKIFHKLWREAESSLADQGPGLR